MVWLRRVRSTLIRSVKGKRPEIHESCVLLENVSIFGNVRLSAKCSVWPGSVLRAEGDESITVGEGTNIQDNCCIHTEIGYDVKIGRNVTVGHGVILHACEIKNHVLIGMGSVVQDGAVIEENCLIGAGALINKGMVVPKGHLAYGVPAKVIRALKPEELHEISASAEEYHELLECILKEEESDRAYFDYNKRVYKI